ncbi:hypothetical protein [Caballeronia sp. GAFFF2]|uniref:hypothetical protein n=1 Tax=Caballeronia sp. GAFFF2 TaxID=2921741 RepID=UPI0020297935|nr:hypothetical protein [Caballeronia sp. GAFFF2]
MKQAAARLSAADAIARRTIETGFPALTLLYTTPIIRPHKEQLIEARAFAHFEPNKNLGDVGEIERQGGDHHGCHEWYWRSGGAVFS